MRLSSTSVLLASLGLAACTRAEVATPAAAAAPPAPAAAAAPATTLDLLVTGDVWGEYGPCG